MHDGVMCRDKASDRGRGSIPPPSFVVWAVYAAVVGAGEDGAVPVGFVGARGVRVGAQAGGMGRGGVGHVGRCGHVLRVRSGGQCASPCLRMGWG